MTALAKVVVVLLAGPALAASQEFEWGSSQPLPPPQGVLESVVSHTSEALQSLWDQDASATLSDDWYSCAKQTKDQYVVLLDDVRRSASRCWGWEPREVEALSRALEDLLFAGDRLPALLRQRMDTCLRHPATISGVRLREARQATGASPFRVLRCSLQCAGTAWSYVSAVPKEALRVARRSAALLGSSREDWLTCASGVLRQSVGPAAQLVKDLGVCVADHLAQHYWEQGRQRPVRDRNETRAER